MSHFSLTLTVSRPVIFWQTRQQMQRDKDHLARHGSIGSSVRSRERTKHSRREDSGRRGQEGNNEIKRLSSRTSDKYKKSGPGNEQSWPSRQREKSPLSSDRISYSHSRTASCSRVRGRSRSPRKPGQPGPGILKSRSTTHDGRREVRWKMLRISRVDDVREFSPWHEERDRHSSDEEIGHDDGQDGGRVDELVENRGEGLQVGPRGGKKVHANQAITTGVYNKEQVEEEAIDEEPVQKDGLDDGSSELPCSSKTKYEMQQNETTKSGRFEWKVIDDKNKSTKDCCSFPVPRATEEEIAFLEDELVVVDVNGNTIEFTGPNDEAPSEDSLDESFHGYDPLMDRNHCPLAGENYEALIEEIESEATKPVASLLEVLLSDGYQSRPVQCRHTDCPTASFPSTLGLLPLPHSGQQWHCSQHSHCLLCTDPPHSRTIVMCTMCARLYHTHHLDMDFVDKKEMELFVCKLCSDPDQFKQTNTEEDQSQEAGINQILLQSHTAENSSKKVVVPNRMEPPVFTQLNVLPSGQVDKKKRVPLHEDTTLPQGWCRKVITSGKRLRVIIIGPGGKRCWSKGDLRKYHGSEGESNWDEFDFTLYGSKGQQ